MLNNCFQTNNTALAVALITAGVPAPTDERGRPMPQAMLYSPGMLQRMGYRDMSADDAAKRALRDEKPGVRLFFFQASELSAKIITAFKRAHEAMEEGRNIYIEEVGPEHIAAITYATNRMRRHVLSAFTIPAFITDEPEVSGEKTEDGGWKAKGKLSAISVGASDKLKQEMRQ